MDKTEDGGTAFMLKGIYYCTHCNNIERGEREILCRICPDGEMVYADASRLIPLLRANDAERRAISLARGAA